MSILSRLSLCGAFLLAVSSQPAIAAKKDKAALALAQLEAGLTSKDPKVYCRSALNLNVKGFFPYCSTEYTGTVSEFSKLDANQAVTASRYSTQNWRQDGDRLIAQFATSLERQLIDDVHQQMADGEPESCLGQSATTCIAFLSERFLVTTEMRSFYQSDASLSFDSSKNTPRLTTISLLFPEGGGPFLSEKPWDLHNAGRTYSVVAVQLYFPKGRVEKLTVSGKYPILSENPLDYQGKGFATFLQNLMPNCSLGDESEFYRDSWSSFVKPARGSRGDGEWHSSGDGIVRGWSSHAQGELCGKRVSAKTSLATGYSARGKWTGGSKELTFEN